MYAKNISDRLNISFLQLIIFLAKEIQGNGGAGS